MENILQRTGAAAISVIREMGRMLIFLGNIIFWMFRPPLKIGRIIKQIGFIGARSTPLIILTGTFTGMILALQGYYTLRKFGADAFLGTAVAITLVRELGPVLSALMITGRAGSAIAAEIGIMKITEQVDALESMSLSPYRYLMVPNMLAAVISVPLLASIYNVVGIYGGYLVAVKLLGLSGGTYISSIQSNMDMTEITDGLIKSFSFGILIIWVSCYQGYYTRHGAEGVSRATTTAVVMSSTLILVWDYFLNSLMI